MINQKKGETHISMLNRSEQASRHERNSADQAMALRRQLLQCMAETLTPRQYQVFVLNYLEGMPQVEIAREFGISASSVSRHLLQAKTRMRRALGYDFAPCDCPADEAAIFPEQPYPVELPGWVHPPYST